VTIRNKYLQHLIALLVYFIFSTLLTWPLILNMRTTLFGDYGDTLGTIRAIWDYINSPVLQSTGQLLAAPFKMSYPPLSIQPVYELLLEMPARFIGEIAAYNLLVVLSFTLTAFVTYLCLNYLLRNKTAPFIGGLIFGFCPASIMQALGGHLTFSFNIFIPIFIIALLHNREMRSIQSAFFLGMSFSLLTLTSIYYGYFAIFIAIYFVVFDYVTIKETKRAFVLNYLTAVFFAFIVTVLFLYKVLYYQITANKIELAQVGRIRGLAELVACSARPWEYLLPSVDHPVLGRFIINFTRNHLHWSNSFEQTLYLGVVPLVFCLIGLYIWRHKDDSKQRCYFLFFMGGFALMLSLSFPPAVLLGTFKVPAKVSIYLPTSISLLIYFIAPMFRVYARFGILANFFLACAAAVVLSELSQKMTKIRYYVFLILLLPVLIFEYWSISPDAVHAIDTPPAVYQWLARQPGNFIIAEYPMMKTEEAAFYTYVFWQRIHQKRMVNGATPNNAAACNFYQKVKDLSNPETPDLLKSSGVKYIIVHKQMYHDGPIPGTMKRYYSVEAASEQYNNGIVPANHLLGKPYMEFGDDEVYRLRG